MRACLVSCLTTGFIVGCSGSGWRADSQKPVPENMDATPLIARDVLFGNPDKAGPQISPDGSKLAYLAAVDGVLNIWVGPLDEPVAAKPVTADEKRGIRLYFWAFDNRHILYLQDKDGDENWHVYATDLKTSQTRDLTPIEGIQARVEEVSYKFPSEILVGINDRDPKLHDVYRINLESGRRELIQQNDGFAGFATDDDFKIRLAVKMTPDGGKELFTPDAGGDGWKSFMKIPRDDNMTTSPVGFDKSGKILYMVDSVGRNTAAFVAHNLETGRREVLASNPRADVSGAMVRPVEKTIEAVSFTYQRRQLDVLDSSIKPDLKYLKKVADGEMHVIDRTLDDMHWLTAYVMDDGPIRYYHYDRSKRRASFLFTNRGELEGLPLTKMHSVVIKSRDGLELVSYLSLPIWADADRDGRPDRPLPMVLLVHGGPWSRDGWGYSSYDQWLSNRGYAVLSVNFRGSTGFGKEFVNAADLEWARKMHDDLVDAVNWAIKKKIADPRRIAIMGGSYGGYATLVGLTFTPKVFACGVDMYGPSNLITLLEAIPPYWTPMLDVFTTRVGDHRTEAGRAMLTERSPLTHVDGICKPLLIGQGGNDPRVKQVESDRIVEAMEQKNIPVAYVLLPDEGHGFARPENSKAFSAVAEAFLARHLGGRYEPIGDDFAGSSIIIREGAEEVPGLAAALSDRG